MSKLIISFFLACLLSASLIACSDTTESKDENKTVEKESESTEVSSEKTEEDYLAELMNDVPKADYEGYEFVMLNNESNFAYTMMTAEELTGEGINDAIYNRNIKVADDLNIKIIEQLVSYSEVTNNMTTSIAGGDPTYSCFWNESYFVAPFAVQGNLYNINEIESINIDRPWWYSDALDDIAIGPYQYFLIGDLHLMFKESYWMVGFNKDILDQNALGDPYELVREGTWTLDQMKTYMETAALDLNGDGQMDGSDRFGATFASQVIMPLIIGSDEVVVEKDEEGIPQLVTPDDRFYNVYEKVVNIMFSDNDYICLEGKTQNLGQYLNGKHDVFLSGHALFYLEPVGSLKKLRDMESEFGIVPFPKYEESQQNYVTYIAKYAALCGIPITADPERTGVILENLCAQSYGDLREAYVDTTLNFKYIRDQESAEMLNLIFSTGRFNLADVLDVSSPASTLESNAVAGNTSIASKYASILNLSNKLLERNVSKLLKEE